MDTQQANRLVAQYSNMILRISYQYLKQTYDAEDICQTVFLKYLTKAPQFENEQHEKAWIIRTTVNACKDYLKSSFFRRTVALDEAETIAAPAVQHKAALADKSSVFLQPSGAALRIDCQKYQVASGNGFRTQVSVDGTGQHGEGENTLVCFCGQNRVPM